MDQAESVSYHLRTPVLLHSHPKPACALPILHYFQNKLPGPTTLAAQIRDRNLAGSREVREDAEEFVRRFSGVAEGPILGPAEVEQGDGGEGGIAGRGVGGRDLIDPFTPFDESSVHTHRDQTLAAGAPVEIASTSKIPSKPLAPSASPSDPDLARASQPVQPVSATEPGSAKVEGGTKAPAPLPDPIRILVIGDRLFTDTLLAHRLRLLIAAFPAPRTTLPDDGRGISTERVISIQTTALHEPKDVRVLRWIEAKLSGGRLREGQSDWGRYVLRPDSDEAQPEGIAGGIRENGRAGWKRIIPFRNRWLSAPELGWKPATWSFWGMVRGGSRGLKWTGTRVGRRARWAWMRLKAWWDLRRAERQAQAQAQAQASAKSMGTSTPAIAPVRQDLATPNGVHGPQRGPVKATPPHAGQGNESVSVAAPDTSGSPTGVRGSAPAVAV